MSVCVCSLSRFVKAVMVTGREKRRREGNDIEEELRGNKNEERQKERREVSGEVASGAVKLCECVYMYSGSVSKCSQV